VRLIVKNFLRSKDLEDIHCLAFHENLSNYANSTQTRK